MMKKKMSDPAVEAAQRADAEVDGYWNTTRDAMEESAREALKPIQKWYNDPNMVHDIHMWRKLRDLIFPDGDLKKSYE